MIGIFLCMLGLLVYMWPRVQIVRLGYGLQSAERRLKDLSRERDQLQLEIALLKNPQRVYGVATEQLGMAVPKPDQVFVLTREGKTP
ncbi:MAG: cell division protein FtsL [Candidatus Entotheonellia bacterium]